MEQIIGGYKEYVIIERELLNSFLNRADELEKQSGVYSQGIAKGMKQMIETIKENNLYNKDFHIKG
jgi:hypothetical protein